MLGYGSQVSDRQLQVEEDSSRGSGRIGGLSKAIALKVRNFHLVRNDNDNSIF
jgi:hypothetical protein